MKKIQYGSDVVINEKNFCKILKYFILECPVGFGYSDLKSYGIEISKTERTPGRPDINECKHIEGIFFDIHDATSFISEIKHERVSPLELTEKLESFIKKKLKRHRELLSCDNKNVNAN